MPNLSSLQLTVNPTSLSSLNANHHPPPGPSSEYSKQPPTVAPSSTPPSTSLRRRRQDSVTDTDKPPTAASLIRNTRKDKDGPKKKKAARACIHCQRAHLTCDDSRPCQRCTKRGMANSCIEGHRKRAKYLLGEDELELIKRKKVAGSANNADPPPQAPAPSVIEKFSPADPLSNPSFDPASFPFGSETAKLEYSILSTILGNPSPEVNPPADSYLPSTPPPLPPSAHPFPHSSSEYDASWSGGPSGSLLPSEPSNFLTSPFVGVRDVPAVFEDARLALPLATERPQTVSSPSPSADFLGQPFPTLGPSSSATTLSAHTTQDSFSSAPQPAAASSPSHSASRPLAPRWPLSTTDSAGLELSGPKTAEEVYGGITKPYDYTEGYHFLMKVLPFRFEKNDILRIVRALAVFRPSLIALQLPLTEEDEIFVEKCVQRSVIELNKLISYSGTPTVVWRRTGEICLVGPEFCMLTEWSKEELLGTKNIFGRWLFENQSAVEYWEKFATHAFENTAQSVYSHCVLLKPNGTPVPATFCFHIRRDLFDLPSLVIGQWLPLL
ncbi:hypothetical protein B0F90DRAFT_1697992 [Multifurca ochricompacta]|uniref:Transcription activator of gluconeogenesis ERT1 n=1 Tax=Multifurca ochricompacta TaxID=376703 RepID=A0AAD4M8A6_9AGAM|nr:hypothetical protein B0F90DRAFT_1697992 [Multifurca ochricompacta]